MEALLFECERLHFGIGDFDSYWILSLIQFRFYSQSGRSPGVANELHDGLESSERFTPPVFCNLAEEAMLDLVPFAGSWRKVRDMHVETVLIRELLQLYFPRTRAVTVASTGIGGDEDFRGIGKYSGLVHGATKISPSFSRVAFSTVCAVNSGSIRISFPPV